MRRIAAVSFGLAILMACAKPPPPPPPVASIDPTTQLERLFETHFQDFAAPAPERIRETGIARLYPGRSFERTWQSALLVLMQDCVLVYASKATGVVVCANPQVGLAVTPETEPSWYIVGGMPEAVLVEPDPLGVRVHASWPMDWYQLIERPDFQLYGIKATTQRNLAAKFHKLLDGEVSAEDWVEKLH